MDKGRSRLEEEKNMRKEKYWKNTRVEENKEQEK